MSGYSQITVPATASRTVKPIDQAATRTTSRTGLRRPDGSCDIFLGRKLGMGCQLKYADGPAVPVATGLRGSPFGLLHASGCLRLVTDGVSEKDALHVALTCRVFRDLLWARFPIRPA